MKAKPQTRGIKPSAMTSVVLSSTEKRMRFTLEQPPCERYQCSFLAHCTVAGACCAQFRAWVHYGERPKQAVVGDPRMWPRVFKGPDMRIDEWLDGCSSRKSRR
jgi:hypothetical protein